MSLSEQLLKKSEQARKIIVEDSCKTLKTKLVQTMNEYAENGLTEGILDFTEYFEEDEFLYKVNKIYGSKNFNKFETLKFLIKKMREENSEEFYYIWFDVKFTCEIKFGWGD